MIDTFLRRLARRVSRILVTLPEPAASSVELWNDRAKKFGARAVFNLAHADEQLAQITDMQKRIIYPHVRAALRQDERLALDFGCGPGRFTADLAKMIQGRAIGVDTTRAFIEMAPAAERVEYRVMTAGQIPVEAGEVDFLWVCLVLGGIVEGVVLERSIRELDRVLRPGGLVVLVENTSPKEDAQHWKFRPVSAYQRLFAFAELEHKGEYEDASERISIMIGRKRSREANAAVS